MQPRFTKLLYTNRSQDKPRLNMNKDGDKIKTLVFSGRAFRSVAWDLTNQLTFKNIRLIVKPMLVAPILHIFHLSHFFKAHRILWWDMHTVHSVASPFHPSTHPADTFILFTWTCFNFSFYTLHFTYYRNAVKVLFLLLLLLLLCHAQGTPIIDMYIRFKDRGS